MASVTHIIPTDNDIQTPKSGATNGRTMSARRLVVAGRVQGLGVRPAIYRLAAQTHLSGTVRNSARGVEIELEGPAVELTRFAEELPNALPEAAHVERVIAEAVVPRGLEEFAIVKEPADGPLTARVPADRTVCPECLEDVFREDDRRNRYSFTGCTQCGPRYSIVRAMPYERDDTTMGSFAFCSPCRDEYQQPGNRRFHAQTNACPTCGPKLRADDGQGKPPVYGDGGLRTAVVALSEGKIVGVLGLGGYQLLVDATNESAVRRLRERKGRQGKPLAVMVDSCETAQRLAHFDDEERRSLTDPAGPIVLACARVNNGLAAAIHPHLDSVGLMLPTTPLHAVLTRDFGRSLVCTSGNREGDPLEFEVESAQRNLEGICDLWLHHDRDVARPIDDSVVRIIAGRRVTIRLARGLAPLSLDLPAMSPTFATGGFLKSAAAWSNGAQAVLGPHIGDQETLAARSRFLDQLDDWQDLYRFAPQCLVHDMHPQYFSTQWAQKQRRQTIAVQHHHAHVVAGMLEHGWLDREVLGIAWDGTGYGTDGTIWGGEFLVSTATSFKQLAYLRPFRLPGGEAAIHEPWRIAVALAEQLRDEVNLGQWRGWHASTDCVRSVREIVRNTRFSPITTSAGRLFDAAAALILGIERAEFDGQAAMRLEAVADRTASGQYPLPLREWPVWELDWRPLFAELLGDCRAGVDPDVVAMRFHRSMAAGIVRVCRSREHLPVVLTGGVFQNRLLTELIVEMMADSPQPLGLPGLIPPNDGGLAAGQLAIAAAMENRLPCA